ncbi:MAG: PVC-type heme-binding CxxCH protein [Verrucomicrobiales bacterium]
MLKIRSVSSLIAATPWWAATVFSAEPFPAPNDTQELVVPLLSARECLTKLALPEGFRATVFAAEPDVNNPIACCWDERGRLWVAENFTYGDGSERFNMNLRDRILIFEDTDHDGVHDRRTVFTDQVQMLTSIERGLGGIWAMAPPHLLFFPDANQDDVPDGPPQVVLDGFSTEAASRHTFANGLKWGPDGWLYGRIGISSTSYIGLPGRAPDQRQGTAGGLWRYHPVHKVVDIVCAGTTNPWGHDWDAQGELFFINTVIGHLWHGIHGAHFKRMHGLDLNPRVYQQLDQIADHYHWDTGGQWQDSRPDAAGAATADSLGGGHAHVGMMIYQGANWPASYRGKLFTINLHGRRVNVERLVPQGSGYVGRHEPDMLKSDDVWFRGIEITYGPDGGVYLLDWSDIGECHENDGVHRNSGRIYKVTYGDPVNPPESDLPSLTEESLAGLHRSDNEWLVRMARWQWREHRHRGRDMKSAEAALARLIAESDDPRLRRQALWTRTFTGATHTEADLLAALTSLDLRSTAISLLGDSLLLATKTGAGPAALSASVRDQLLMWAGPRGTAPLRLKLASFAIKHPDLAIPLLERLLGHAQDAADPSLPLMYWYAMMDLPTERLAPLFAKCEIPLVRKFVARRCAEDIEKNPAPLNHLLASGHHPADLLAGLGEALDGWAKAPRPTEWPAFSASLKEASLQRASQSLDIVFGDGRALDDIKKIVLDGGADLPRRESALRSLVTAHPEGLKYICQRVLTTHGLSIPAMQGLALFDDPEVGRLLARRYGAFYPHEQQSVIDTLTTRPVFAEALLEALAAGRIPKSAVTAAQARQIRALNSESLNRKLAEVWGEIRDSSAEKLAQIADLKSRLTPEALAHADPRAGRVVFNQACASCHKLYGEGHLIGPDLTGSGRHDINYLIENIVDPSALLAADYRMTLVTTTDGRVLSGNIASQTDRTLTLKMVGAEQTVERTQIASIQQLPLSLMPEGMLQPLTEKQVHDLFAYLTSSAQVELP